jgi:hypothetical protein
MLGTSRESNESIVGGQFQEVLEKFANLHVLPMCSHVTLMMTTNSLAAGDFACDVF